MAPRCCGIQGLRAIRVGNSKAGVAGLDRVLEEAFRSGRRPDQEGLKKALVDALRAEGNYIAASSEEDYGAALVELYHEYFKEAQPRTPTKLKELKGDKMRIEILGPGCARCRATEQNVRKALAELKIEAEVEHISDPAQFARRGVMLTPGVIVDGKVVSSGRVPDWEEVKAWLSPRAAA